MEPLQHQRRIHQHHAVIAARNQDDFRSGWPAAALARDQGNRLSSHNRALVERAGAASQQQQQQQQPQQRDSLEPRLIFGPFPDEGSDDGAGSGTGTGGNGNGNGGGQSGGGGKGGGGGNSGGGNLGGGHSGGNNGGTPHNPGDPVSGSGAGGDDEETSTSTRAPRPTSTSTSTTSTPTTTTTRTTRTTTSRTERTTSTSSTTLSTSTAGPLFTVVAPSQSTTVVQVTASAEPTGSGSGSGESDNANSSSTTRVGPIIGIIAGVLVGIALVSVVGSVIFRKLKSRNEDPYESDPFDRNDFQRQSVMLPADNFSEDDHVNGGGIHSPEMSERSPYLDPTPMMGMGAAVAGVGAAAYNNHNNSGREQGGPRPPTMFARHLEARSNGQDPYNHGGMPSVPQVGGIYSPGEYTNTVVPSMPPAAATAGYGTDPSVSPFMGPGVVMGHANAPSPYAHLDRARSASSQYVDLDRSGSGSSSGAANGGPAGAYRSQSRQGVLDSMTEESGEYGGQGHGQQQQSYDIVQTGPSYVNTSQQQDPFGASAAAPSYQNNNGYLQQPHQPVHRAATPDNGAPDDAYGGLY